MSTWMSIEGHRRLVQVFPDPVQKLWSKYELRGLVLISLVSQMILAILGNRKRFRPNIWRRPLVWAAYLMADWVATFALGVITSMLGDYYDKSSGEQKDINPQLIAFWAPFFLIHLGGPDSITAYALEDNELWLRHLVGLVTQTIVTFYIILMTWNSTSWLSYLSIPVLIIGFIKYGERVWSLYSASSQHLRDSLLSWKNDISRRDFDPDSLPSWADGICPTTHSELRQKWEILQFLGVSVSQFGDMILDSKGLRESRSNFMAQGPSNMNEEMEMLYDVFYTKAFAIYNYWGVTLRFITCHTTASILVLHIIFTKSNGCLLIDCLITYLILVGSLILEFYSLLLSFSHKWSDRYTPKGPRGMILRIVIFIVFGPAFLILIVYPICCPEILKLEERKLYQTGQANFLTLICDENKKSSVEALSTKRIPNIGYIEDSGDLLSKVFSHYEEKLESDQQSNIKVLPRPGYRDYIRKQLNIAMASNLEFHQTIIAWHIATDLCYCRDSEIPGQVTSSTSKQLSDYMFYLLVKCRHMLPVGAGLLTYRDTFEDAKKYFPKKDNLTEACKELLQVDANISNEEGSMSVFFHACTIARELLRSRENENEMWEFLDGLWIEILSYASANCRVDNHAQQLRRGAEFLSSVWLLQAHLCLLEQFEGIMERQMPVERDTTNIEA